MEENRKIDRILIGAPKSGSGKTMFTTVYLYHLLQTGENPIGFKCGPDYIDPMFHQKVTGVPCRNLDPFFLNGKGLRSCLSRASKGHSIAVLEGVMGYYDGGDRGELSTRAVGKETKTKAVLVVDAKGAAISALAIAKGLATFEKDSGIVGVIFNRMHQTTYEQIKRLYDEGEYTFSLLGYIPVLPKEVLLESRHLGLVTPGEISAFQEKIARSYELMKDTVDWQQLHTIAESTQDLEREQEEELFLRETPEKEKLRIAVAKDDAFCFYYEDNLDLLRQAGCEIAFFSPLLNEAIPEHTDGLWIGGGYPELYLNALEENEITKQSIVWAIKKGIPVIAECGGFMYLNALIEGKKMCGVLSGELTKKNRLVRFGYITLEAKEDSLLFEAGDKIPAHEFHYYDSTDNGTDLLAKKRNGVTYDCAVAGPTMYAGFPHLYLGSDPKAVKRFCDRCREVKRGQI